MNRLSSILLNSVLVAMILAGCTLPQRRAKGPKWLTELEQIHGELLPGEIVDVQRGRLVDFDDLLDRLEGMRVVYVGETHSAMAHHEVQLKILRGLYQRDSRIVIGMEMFERPFQKVLDSWSEGAIDRKTLLREADWFSRWRFDFSLYEEILLFARQNGIKILALNAQRELVAKVGDFGQKALSPGERAMIAPLDASDTLHREYVRGVFDAHHKTPGQSFENFYEAQCVWDDTMAETIARFLGSEEGKGSRVVVLSGAGHMVYKLGIPERVSKRTSLPYTTILPSTTEWMQQDNFGGRQDPALKPADFLWVTEASLRTAIRLGVVIEESEVSGEGMVVREVTEGSAAERAGIEPGDMIRSIDGEPVSDMVDLKVSLSRKRPGSTGRVVLSRGGESKEMEVLFSSVTSPHQKPMKTP
jgi:uncharacterized iron-regulated protein